jgi:hypothetical protein
MNDSCVDRHLFSHRLPEEEACLSDLLKVHSGLLKVEEAANRKIRQLGREVSTNTNNLNKLSKETNDALFTLSQKLDNIDMGYAEEGEEHTFQEAQDFGDSGGEPKGDDEQYADDVGHQVNMVGLDSTNFSLPMFSGDSSMEFGRWARKFNDFADCHGKNWDDRDGLARLKMHLDGEARRIFDALLPAQKDTVAHALAAIKDCLNSPQRRELVYQALASCRHVEGEPVKEFLARLIPLVEATSENLTAGAKEEILCRTLLDKLQPQLSFLLKTASLAAPKEFKTLCIQAQEAELLLASTPKNSNPLNLFAAQPTAPSSSSSPANFPRGNFASWNPTNANRVPIGGNRSGQGWNAGSGDGGWRQGRSANTGRPNFYDNDYDEEGLGPSNDQSMLFCVYCQIAGHTIFNCYKRERDFQQEECNPENYGNTQEDENADILAMISNLAFQVHEISVKFNSQSADQINSVQNVKKGDQGGKLTTKKIKEAGKPKPVRISSWEDSLPPKFLPYV